MAVAVVAEKVPVEGGLVADPGGRNCVIMRMVKVVPTGVFVMVKVTGTGFTVSVGSATSAVEYDPVGVAGDVMPPISLIVKVGKFVKAGSLAAFTGPGVENEAAEAAPVKVCVNASSRVRPTPPAGHDAFGAPPEASNSPLPPMRGATNRIAPPLPGPDLWLSQINL